MDSTAVGPRVIQVLEFANARAIELQALHELAHSKPLYGYVDAKLVTQKNQRRRRANAFKSHRMPQRLRQRVVPTTEEDTIALAPSTAQDGSANAQTSKKAKKKDQSRCRKHTRRMHVLAGERQMSKLQGTDESEANRVVRWLPTHAWHTKRMKMQEMYGMVLPAHRADKSVSAALTALRTHATLHDASYLGLLELQGHPQLILEALQLVSDPAGSDFHESRFLAGNLEGESVLYHANQFPHGAICPVTFMWRPFAEDFIAGDDGNIQFQLRGDWQARTCQLWLWIHPAAYMEAATAIAQACQAVVDEGEEISIVDRRGDVARFRLRGKLANDILDELCSGHSTCSMAEDVDMAEATSTSDENGFTAASIHQICGGDNIRILRNSLSDRKHGNANQLISVEIRDPRVGVPCSESGAELVSLMHEPSQESILHEQIKCPVSQKHLADCDADEPESERIMDQLSNILQWASTTSSNTMPFPLSTGKTKTMKRLPWNAEESTVVPCSELWAKQGRVAATRRFRKDHELNQQEADVQQASAPDVPLIVVKKVSPFPHSGGWDLITLPEYAPSLLKWMSFKRAMVIGLDEDAAISTVAHLRSFPRDFPDTNAGREHWEALEQQAVADQERKPKAKRIAFEKNGVVSPFQPHWDLLFPGAADNDDEDGGENNVAYRNRVSTCVLRGEQYMEPFCFYTKNNMVATAVEPEVKPHVPVALPTLVSVVLAVPRRGTVIENTMLYVPTAEDVKKYKEDGSWNGFAYEKDQFEEEHELLGFITSAVYDRPKSAFRARGFCACDRLQELFRNQVAVKGQVMALMRTPTSRTIRPVMIAAVDAQ